MTAHAMIAKMNTATALILFILSIVIAVWIARHFMQTARPLYVFSVMSLGGVRHPDIDLIYDGRNVPTIHSVKLVFWNAGRKEIRRKDLPSGDAALRVCISDDYEILGADAQTSSNCAANAEIVDANTVRLDFEFLNKKDSYFCELICTNIQDGDRKIESKPPDPKLRGSIIGANIRRGSTSSFAKSDIAMSVLGILAVLFMMGIWFAGPIAAYRETGEPISYTVIVLGLAYLLIILPAVSASLFGYTKRMVPEARKQLHEPVMPTRR